MFCALGVFVCVKSRAAGGAVVFALIGALLLLATPLGGGLPGALSGFVWTVDQASPPALSTPEGGAGRAGAGAGPAGGAG